VNTKIIVGCGFQKLKVSYHIYKYTKREERCLEKGFIGVINLKKVEKMSEVNGIVTLEELPEKEIYVEVDSEFKEKIKDWIKNKHSLKEFSEKIETSVRIIEHWLSEESLLRLDTFKAIIKYFGLDCKTIKIVSLRGKSGARIINPKLPFDFTTKSGVRIIAAILGDGSLSKKSSIYSNTNLELIDGFIEDAKNVFGSLELKVRPKEKGSNVLVVDIPNICSKVLENIGLPAGSKVENNPHIPRFIFNLGKEKIAEFISQIIDDEGSVSIASRHLKIGFCVIETEERSNLIYDLQKLLLKLNIESEIYQYEKYESSRGPARKKWQIEIHSFERLEKLHSMLNLRHKERLKQLEKLLKSKKLTCYPRKKCTEFYLSKMREIEEEKGFFTSVDLLKKINRSLGHTRNMIHKYWNKGLIQKIEKVSSDGTKFYPAKYRVIK